MSLDRNGQKLAVFEGRAEYYFKLWSKRIGTYLEGKGLAHIVNGNRIASLRKQNQDDSDYNVFLKEIQPVRSIIVQALRDGYLVLLSL